MRLAVLGVGLIGGSVALAARQRLGAEVTGYDDSPEALERALQLGALNCARSSVTDAVAGAQAVFVAVPVGGL
jgi:prephenate dehydrogenase